MAFIIETTTSIRNIKSEMGIAPQRKIEAFLKVKSKTQLQILKSHTPYIRNLARVSRVKMGPDVEKPIPSASAVIGKIEIWIPLKGLIDMEKEKRRLKRQLEKATGELKRVRQKLESKEFLSKAPREIIVKERKKKKELKERRERLKKNLESLT